MSQGKLRLLAWLMDGEIQIKDALKVTKYTINKHKQCGNKQTNQIERRSMGETQTQTKGKGLQVVETIQLA